MISPLKVSPLDLVVGQRLLQVPCEVGFGIHAARSESGALHKLEHDPRSSPGTALCMLARQDDKIIVRRGSVESIVLVRLGRIRETRV